jgi:D-inositol-3-phosphate glycosyltransferase
MKRRIALISEHASPLAALGGVDAGGQNVYVGELARHLARIGYSVDVFTRADRPDLPPIVTWRDDVRIVHIEAGPSEPIAKEDLWALMPAFADATERYCREQTTSYDLFHANFWMSGWVASEMKRRLGTPFVVTFHALGKVRRAHQGDADRSPEERIEVEADVVREAEHVIAECPQEEEDLIRLYGADPVRIQVIPAGFDPGELYPVRREAARARLQIPHDERVLLQLGRMVPRKGVDDVIRGFATFLEHRDVPARLLIAGGDGPEPDPERTPEIGRLKEIAEEVGVSERVHFLGCVARMELRTLYSAADVFLSTPWYEPFGITPLEAMACGVPVIGSSVGGIKFSVRDGETGYLVPPNDPGAIANRLERLLMNPRVLTLFRSRAVRRVNDMFTWRHVADQMAALYERVLSGERLDQMVRGDYSAVEASFDELAEALSASARVLPEALLSAADVITGALASGRKVLVCGNGGSAAEAQHLAAELVGGFRDHDRGPLAAVSLSSDTAVLTAWANDASFDDIFARQVVALGRPGDVLVALSTSGTSANVVRAVQAGAACGLHTVAMVGAGGGTLAGLADVPIIVPSADTARIQEVHMLGIHVLSELVEERAGASAAPAISEARPA